MIEVPNKSRFLSQLINVDLCLDDRLQMAYGAIISTNLSIPGKEQIVIDWFAECFAQYDTHFKSLFKMLKKCLKSDYLLAFSEAIDATKIIEVFSRLHVDSKIKYSNNLITCILLILKSKSFQRFCRFEILPLCQASLLICELYGYISSNRNTGLLKHSSVDDDLCQENSYLDELFSNICDIYKVTQQRSELKLRFVKYFLPALMKLKYNFQHSVELHKVLDELVIGEDLELILEAFKLKPSKNIHEYLRELVKLMTGNAQQCNIVALNRLLFEVYVDSCMKNDKAGSNHLSMFYTLVSVADFPLELPFDTIKASSNVSEKRLLILIELTEVLQHHNIPISSESEEGILSNVLITILKQLVSEGYCLSSDLLRAVHSIFNIHPESVKQVFSGFVRHFVFVKKPEKVSKVYNSLLVDVVKIFCNLNQLDKFFSLFFHGAMVLSKEHIFAKLSSDTVLSSGFYTLLLEKLPTLTGNQFKSILGRLEKTFSKELITPLEDGCTSDINLKLLVKIMVNIVCHILENAPIIMSTRWNLITVEMTNLIADIQRFGLVVVKCLEPDFLMDFLKLVRIMADVELIVNQYVISLSSEKILPIVKSKEKSNCVFNLSKSHGFLPTSDWKIISEIVMDSYDSQLKQCWFALLLQKYVRLADPEVITHLTLVADADWLWNTVDQLATCVPLKHMELYTGHLLARCAVSAERLASLTHVNIASNRAFRTAMIMQTLKLMSKTIAYESALTRHLVKLIDIHMVIEYEIDMSLGSSSEMSTIIEALAEVVSKCLWDYSSTPMNDESKEYVNRLIDVLTMMGPYCLKVESKRIIFLTLMGLAYDFKEEDGLQRSILEIILGLVDDSGSLIAEALDRRVLVYWLVSVVPDALPLQPQLMQLVIHQVLPTLDQCVEGMGQVLQTNHTLLFVLLESLTEINGNKNRIGKEEFHKTVNQLISLASSVITKPKEKYFRLYTASMKAEFLILKNKSLISNLPSYLDILFERFEKDLIVEANATELIDLTFRLKAEIDEEVIDKAHLAITRELCKLGLCPILCYPNTVKMFFESLSTDEFEKALNEIYKHQQEGLSKDKEVASVGNVCEVWTIVVSAHLDKAKARVRQKLVTKMLTECQPLLMSDPSTTHPSVLKLLHSVTVYKSILLVPKLLDVILVILGDVPTDSMGHLLPDCLSVMDALVNVRAELVYDRIPAFLQRLRKLIKSLVLLSSGEEDNLPFNSVVTSSVNQVTRIIRAITDHHSKHFARIAPYLIADVLELLTSYAIEPSVKGELQNCVCSLLRICDQHGTQLLTNRLPLPATELFKAISSTYRKSFKYTGKV